MRDDEDIATALGRQADALTTDLDVDAAWRDVTNRARARRRRRSAATALGAAAAAVVAVAAMVAVAGRDREVLRAPATQPTVAVTTAPVSTATTAPPTTAPTTVATTVPATAPAAAPPTSPVTTAQPSPPVPATSTYSASGGSITVRLAGGQVMLDGDPMPASGWSVRIDDNGPDRVRVRFEMGGQRSEIRVDVVDGQLVPRITES